MAGSRAAAIGLLATLLGGCATSLYVPCPIETKKPLPDTAFEICRRVLARRYGALETAEPAAFRLQTGWAAVDDPPGENRASVFMDRGELVVAVEARWIGEPLIGLPRWSAVRGDAAAERELAAELATALDAAAIGATGR